MHCKETWLPFCICRLFTPDRSQHPNSRAQAPARRVTIIPTLVAGCSQYPCPRGYSTIFKTEEQMCPKCRASPREPVRGWATPAGEMGLGRCTSSSLFIRGEYIPGVHSHSTTSVFFQQQNTPEEIYELVPAFQQPQIQGSQHRV